MKIKKFFKSQAGFTLIELLVVIGIIAVLATIGIVSFGSASATARDTKRLADIRTIQSAIEIYNANTGDYPLKIAAATWPAFLTTIGASTIAPPATGESYCYQLNAAGTRYVLVASDFEKDVPDTSSDLAVGVGGLIPGYTLARACSKATAAACTVECTDQTTPVAAQIDCAAGSATVGDYCLEGGL